MFSSRTQVINRALSLLDVASIDDPDEGSEPARQAKLTYDQTIQAELEKNAWFFAKTQAALPTLAQAPLFKFAFAYQLPPDFIRLIELEHRWVFSTLRGIDTDPRPTYEMQGRKILTDLGSPLRITYLRDVVSEPTSWTPLFTEVAVTALAMALAMALTSSGEKVKLMEAQHKRAISQAARTNAIQMPPHDIPDGSWITARALA